jgi:hypothetical protein
VIEDRGALDPGIVDFKLEAALAENEVRGKMQRETNVASVVSSAIQLGSLKRSGTSATSTAPASGTRRISVRID